MCDDPTVSALITAGPSVASGVALAVAAYADVNRRIDNRSSARSDARNVVVVSWPEPTVTNASADPIRNVAMVGGDRFTTSTAPTSTGTARRR